MSKTLQVNGDEAAVRFQRQRIAHWNRVGERREIHRRAGRFYQKELARYYKLMIPPGLRVLEVGCAQGDLLAALEPSVGVGVDFSGTMLKRALDRHPRLRFVESDAHALALGEKFDVIVLSDLINDLWDVHAVFDRLRTMAHSRTRLVVNTYNHLWEVPITLSQHFGMSQPTLEQNWLTVEDVLNLLQLTGFEVIKYSREILLPLYVPLLSRMANRFLAKVWPCSRFALTYFIVARPGGAFARRDRRDAPIVSVIVPARNEAGNIEGVLARTPEMGAGTELVFVEGHSRDDTYATIERAMAAHPERKSTLIKQIGQGKGDAVRRGFAQARGEILMILDADLTVPPESLARFYEVLSSGSAEFINGVRLIYPLENQSMRFLNLIGNKFFSLAFSWLLGQPVKDTLCGTKILWKDDYELIAANRGHFGDFDPFGDFDLLFGAARLNLKIVDLPIRYRERTYGTTNIQRWRHGWLLLKMVIFAARRIKFV